MLDENEWAVAAFLVCTPVIAGLGSVAGIAATEVASAVRLLRIPRAEWPAVARKVHYMGRCLAQIDAERQARSAKLA